jgi:hypothetical protein
MRIEERILTMRLYYFDHVPADYEPPLFRAAEDDRIYLPDTPVKIKVGDVVTPHHTYVSLSVATHPSAYRADCARNTQFAHAHPHERHQL